MNDVIKEFAALWIYGVSRKEMDKQKKCVACGKQVAEFRDMLSANEYKISGMCQACQDLVFGE